MLVPMHCNSHTAAMPLRTTIYHPDRMVIGVASGQLTIADMIDFGREVVASGTLHYRKIIDVVAATPGFTEQELAGFLELVRGARTDRPRGPLAIVADSARGDIARAFAQLSGEDRPAQVFRSIHEARRWLSTTGISG